MNKILVIAALLVAGAIVFSPIVLHSYKMSECMEIQMKSIEGYKNLGEQYAKERCLSLINSGK